VVRVPGSKPRGLGFDSRYYQIFHIAVDLEWGPLSLMRINEELLERKKQLQSRKLKLITVWDPPCDTPLSTNVGTKFR
jgi:hypothetical protein